jgi:hypothetical protein
LLHHHVTGFPGGATVPQASLPMGYRHGCELWRFPDLCWSIWLLVKEQISRMRLRALFV